MTKATRPRKKKTTTVVEEVGDNSTGFDDEPISEFDVALESVEDSETLRWVLEQFGQTENVLYRIYRQTPTGPSFCYESPTYDVGFLQRERGAGAYTVRIFVNGRFKRAITEQVDAPTNGTAPANDPASSHAAFLEKMLLTLLARENPAPAAGPSITELTAALANLDTLRGKQETGLDLVLKGVQLAKDLQGDSGGPSGDWKTEGLRMVREALPGVTSILQSRLGNAPGSPVSQPPATQEQPMTIDPNAVPPEQKELMLRQGIEYLKAQFIGGLDPESALNFIVANSSNPNYQIVIKEILKHSFDDLVKLDGELQSEPFNQLFRTLYDGLRSEFGSDDTVGDDSGRDTGNDADARNNGVPSKGRK